MNIDHYESLFFAIAHKPSSFMRPGELIFFGYGLQDLIEQLHAKNWQPEDVFIYRAHGGNIQMLDVSPHVKEETKLVWKVGKP